MKEQHGNKEQINFKLSLEERQNINEMATSSGLSLSEYCRIKSLMDENTLISQLKRIAELEKEVKVLKVKASCFKNPNVSSYDVVLKLTEKQRNLLERIYGEASKYYGGYNFKDSVKNDLNYNILYFLMIAPIKTISMADTEKEGFDEDGNIITEPEYNNFLDALNEDVEDYWRDLIEEEFREHYKNNH